MPLSCRFYAEKFPEIRDTVMVNVQSVAELGAYVSLLEYNNIEGMILLNELEGRILLSQLEGMILLSELSKRRIRSVNKLIRAGQNECVEVISVDKEKGYIELSKRRVDMKYRIQCADRFAKAKAVNSILT